MRQSLSRTSFVGRMRELDELNGGLEDALAGHGRLFLISGEPGIGKTRLAGQLATHASERHALVIWGRCWEGSGAPAYWPWIQIFRSCVCDQGFSRSDLMPDSEPLLVADLVPEVLQSPGSVARPQRAVSNDPEQERFGFFDSAARLLKRLSSLQPLVIFIDDLQAADVPSMQMLTFVARELKGARLLLVGTYRDNEIRNSPPVSRLFANLVREGSQLPLRGLNRTEIEVYLNQRAAFQIGPDLIDALTQVTGGNPLFLDGMVRTLEAEHGEEHDRAVWPTDFTIPHGVHEAIRTRLNSLSADANSGLRIVAVIGKEFDLDCVRRIGGRSLTSLLGPIDELTRDGVTIAISGGQLGFRFSHDLIRETIYKDIT